MALNKNEKLKVLKAIKLLDLPERKQEVSENANEIKISWIERTPTEILENIDSREIDEELLGKLAEQVFSLIKSYPKLLQEVGAKYFTN